MVTGRHLGLDGSLDPGRGAADEHGTGFGGRSIQSGEPITSLGRQRPCRLIVRLPSTLMPSRGAPRRLGQVVEEF